MLVVADSSALITLAIGDALTVLDALFSRVHVPPAVMDEVSVRGKPQAARLRRYLEGKVVPVHTSHVRWEGRVGRGEAEAMALYEQLNASFLLIDDSRARSIARRSGIPVVGSLGVLLRVKEKGIVERITPFMERLRTSGLYLSEDLIRDVLEQAGER